MKMNIRPLGLAHRRKASFFPALVVTALTIAHAGPSKADTDTAYGTNALFNNQGYFNSAVNGYGALTNATAIGYKAIVSASNAACVNCFGRLS